MGYGAHGDALPEESTGYLTAADKGSLFLIREINGSVTVTVRAPRTKDEVSINVDAETWQRMRDPGKPHFLTKWEKDQYENRTFEEHFPRAGADSMTKGETGAARGPIPADVERTAGSIPATGATPMTLCDRLRNPGRVDTGFLDEARTIADMREAADALDGNRALRSALLNVIRSKA